MTTEHDMMRLADLRRLLHPAPGLTVAMQPSDWQAVSDAVAASDLGLSGPEAALLARCGLLATVARDLFGLAERLVADRGRPVGTLAAGHQQRLLRYARIKFEAAAGRRP
jgi:hypothetical protein